MHDPRIGRRQFLGTGLSAAGAGLLGWGVSGCTDRFTGPAAPLDGGARANVADPPDLPEPRVIASVGGVLTASLVAATTPTIIAGRIMREAVTYDGTFPGPTLRVRPGDLVDLTFTNRIVFDQEDEHTGPGAPRSGRGATNLHYHGMHLSPLGTADNMLVVVPRNGTWRYRFQVPLDHPSGLFWYHAHVHPTVTNHVSRGAAGMLYVAGAHTDLLAQLGIRHRLLMLQQAYLDEDERTLISDDGERDDPARALSLVNGALQPEIRLRPGEPQVWSLVNASSSAFYLLRLDGHLFDVVAEDGVPLRAARTGLDSLLLASGQRAEIVVRGGARGRYALRYDRFDQGVDVWPAKPLGTVVVDGDAWSGPQHPGPDPFGAGDDLSLLAIPAAQRRTLTLGVDEAVEEGEFGRFTINGHPWDHEHAEWTSTLGTVEEWTFVNETPQDHPMHVHVNPWQVTHVNGVAVPFVGYRDTVTVPRFGTLTVRTRFTDFAGGPVLIHCHILDHEDMGMMIYFNIA